MPPLGIDVIIGTAFKGRGLAQAERQILGFAARSSAALAGLGALSTKLASDFERGFAQVNTIVGLTGQAFDDLREGALRVAGEAPQSIGDLNKALFDLVSAGIPAADSIDALGLSSRAATAGAASLTDAANAGVSVLNAFGLSASELNDVFDVQFATIKRGVTTFEELSAFQGQLIPQAVQLGVGYKEMFAALAFLTTQGQRTRIAVGGLRQAFQSLVDVQDVLAKEGIRLFDAQTGAFRGILPVIEDFRTRVAGLSDEQRALFFSMIGLTAEAQRAIVPMITNFDRLQATIEEVATQSADAMSDAYQEMAKTASVQMGIAGNAIKTQLIATIGDVLLPQLKAAARAVTEFSNAFREMDRSTSTTVVFLGEFVVAMTAMALGTTATVAAVKRLAVAMRAAGLVSLPFTGMFAGLATAIGLLDQLSAKFTDLRSVSQRAIDDMTAEQNRLTESVARSAAANERLITSREQLAQVPAMAFAPARQDITAPGGLPVIDRGPRFRAEDLGQEQRPGGFAADELRRVISEWRAAIKAQEAAVVQASLTPALQAEAAAIGGPFGLRMRGPRVRRPDGADFGGMLDADERRRARAEFDISQAFPQMEATERQAAVNQLLAERLRETNEAVRERMVAEGLLKANTFSATRALGGLQGIFGDLLGATSSFKARMIGMWASLLQSILTELATARKGTAAGGVLGFFASFLSMFERGGIVRAQHGGLVRGGIPGVDSVPILAQRGEVVIPRRLSMDLLNFFETIGGIGAGAQRGGIVMGGAAGGLVIQNEWRVEAIDAEGVQEFLQSDAARDAVRDMFSNVDM